jgi:hypothetical protein
LSCTHTVTRRHMASQPREGHSGVGLIQKNPLSSRMYFERRYMIIRCSPPSGFFSMSVAASRPMSTSAYSGRFTFR